MSSQRGNINTSLLQTLRAIDRKGVSDEIACPEPAVTDASQVVIHIVDCKLDKEARELLVMANAYGLKTVYCPFDKPFEQATADSSSHTINGYGEGITKVGPFRFLRIAPEEYSDANDISKCLRQITTIYSGHRHVGIFPDAIRQRPDGMFFLSMAMLEDRNMAANIKTALAMLIHRLPLTTDDRTRLEELSPKKALQFNACLDHMLAHPEAPPHQPLFFSWQIFDIAMTSLCISLAAERARPAVPEPEPVDECMEDAE